MKPPLWWFLNIFKIFSKSIEINLKSWYFNNVKRQKDGTKHDN